MSENKEEELARLLASFSNFIRVHILKYNLQKYGIDPDDIAQEIKIKLWRVLNHEKIIDHRPSYIKKVIDSTIIDHLRRWKREEAAINQAIMRMIADNSKIYQAPEIPIDDRLQEIIIKSINLLIESRRKAVKLFLLNMSLDEIARHYSWSKDKTRNLLYRGLSDLKRILKEKDIYYDTQE
jgi:RNA polymerase sigma factor (sigma-70 family)